MRGRGPLRYSLIGTPLQEPAAWVRDALDPRRLRRPELEHLRAEDRQMLAIMRRRLQPQSSCIDVGSHYGSMLSRMTRLAPGGRHIAFEPMAAKVDFLRRRFPRADVRAVALSDECGDQPFWENLSLSGMSGLRRRTGFGTYAERRVPCRRLDDEVPTDRRFDLVKLDVECAELLVLRGATQLIGRDQPDLLFECGPDGHAEYGYRPVDLFRTIVGLGYSVFTTHGWLAGDPPVDAEGFERAGTYPFAALNWFATTTG